MLAAAGILGILLLRDRDVPGTHAAAPSGLREAREEPARIERTEQRGAGRTSVAPEEVVPGASDPGTTGSAGQELVLAGLLLRQEGPWRVEDLPSMGELVLELELPGGRRRQVSVHALPEEAPGGPGERPWEVSFQTGDLDPGLHVLRLFDSTGARWSPSELVAVPPARDLAFLRLDLGAGLPVELELLDGATGETLPDPEAAFVATLPDPEGNPVLRTSNLLAMEIAPGTRFSWSAWAGDHAPFFGTEEDLERQDGRWFARRELRLEPRPGWHELVLVLGPDRQPLAGAEVLVDGQATGVTDERGTLVVRREQAPARLEVRALGLVQVGDPLPRGRRANPERRGHVLLVRMEHAGR